jgi:hypothetical protein
VLTAVEVVVTVCVAVDDDEVDKEELPEETGVFELEAETVVVTVGEKVPFTLADTVAIDDIDADAVGEMDPVAVGDCEGDCELEFVALVVADDDADPVIVAVTLEDMVVVTVIEYVAERVGVSLFTGENVMPPFVVVTVCVDATESVLVAEELWLPEVVVDKETDTVTVAETESLRETDGDAV